MTYAGFLSAFVVAPILVSLALLAGPRWRLVDLAPFGGLLAIVYAGTVPWDSAAVAHGFWSFDPTRTWPWRVAGLPLEECAFFGLQTVLTGLWVRSRLRAAFGERVSA